MKKILCIALAMTMAAGMLAGCSDKKDNEEGSKPDSSVSNSSSSNVESTPESSEVQDTKPETVIVKSNNERLAYIIDSVRDKESKEAFIAQTNNDNGALDALGLTEEDVAEYSLTFSQLNVHAYMIAIIKPAEGKEDVVTAAFKSYHQAMVDSFEQYLPDQFEIASNAIVFEHAGYVGLVMCEDSATVESNIEAALSKINNIQVVPDNTSSSTEEEDVSDISSSEQSPSDSSSSDSSSSASDTSITEDKATNSEVNTEKDKELNKATKNEEKADKAESINSGADTDKN